MCIRDRLRGAIGVASFASLPAWAQEGSTEFQAPVSSSVRNNVSSFRMPQWQDYFENTRGGAILADTKSRALHFWSEDQSIYLLYPSSVPLSEELTRLGRTEVVRKAVNPPWRPTASMLERNPDWPKMVEGGAPDNPLGCLLYTSKCGHRQGDRARSGEAADAFPVGGRDKSQSGQRGAEHQKKSQAVASEDRGSLRSDRPVRECVGSQVPGKPGENMASQPLRGGPACRHRECQRQPLSLIHI